MSDEPTTQGVQIDVNAYVARWRDEAGRATDRAIQAELALETALRERNEARQIIAGMGKQPGGDQ